MCIVNVLRSKDDDVISTVRALVLFTFHFHLCVVSSTVQTDKLLRTIHVFFLHSKDWCCGSHKRNQIPFRLMCESSSTATIVHNTFVYYTHTRCVQLYTPFAAKCLLSSLQKLPFKNIFIELNVVASVVVPKKNEQILVFGIQQKKHLFSFVSGAYNVHQFGVCVHDHFVAFLSVEHSNACSYATDLYKESWRPSHWTHSLLFCYEIWYVIFFFFSFRSPNIFAYSA